MSTILVIDDEAICRELVSAVLRGEGHRTVCACNAVQALMILSRDRPDLALLDVIMPGMDGMTLLETMRSTPEWKSLPVILLTQVADKSFVLRARQLCAQDYVLKSRFVVEDFLSRVNKFTVPRNGSAAPDPLAPGPAEPGSASPAAEDSARATPFPMAGKATAGGRSATRAVLPGAGPAIRLSREQTLQRVRQYARPRTLAGVVAEVIAIAGSPRTSAAELAAALSRDPVLAARVLEVANSVAFAGGKTRTANLDEAVTKIGFADIRSIAARIGIFDAFPPEGPDGFNVVRAWQHSFAVAALMELLLTVPGGDPDAVAHLVGLCHDLGKLVLRQVFAQEYSFAARAAAAGGRPLRDMEAEVFGVGRAELVGEVLSTIGLPQEIVAPIREFFLQEEGVQVAEVSPLARTLQLANAYAHGILLASSVESRVRPFTREECGDAPGATRSDAVDARKLRSEVLIMTHLLAKLPAAEVAQLSKPLVEPRKISLWYAQHESFVALDPVAAALQFLCECQVRKYLPRRTNDLESCRGLVVTGPKAGELPLLLPDLDGIRRAASKDEFPILCLAGEMDETLPEPPKNITVLKYPVSLARLAEWTAGVPAGK